MQMITYLMAAACALSACFARPADVPYYLNVSRAVSAKYGKVKVGTVTRDVGTRLELRLSDRRFSRRMLDPHATTTDIAMTALDALEGGPTPDSILVTLVTSDVNLFFTRSTSSTTIGYAVADLQRDARAGTSARVTR